MMNQMEGFSQLWKEVQQDVHKLAKSKGWWDKGLEENSGAVAIALMHSELSEGLEALRKDLQSDHIPSFKGIEEELADVVIRIMDYAEIAGLDIANAIVAKHIFNSTRSKRHGGKKF